ncbi:MAG: hypothetical protein ABW004_09625, partial [Aeromicrobium sp.]
DVLRAVAVTTWPLDEREVVWAMDRASELVDRLGATDAERRGIRTTEIAPAPPAVPPTTEPGAVERADASPDAEEAQVSGGSTEDDVTVHCDDRWPTVRTIFDESSTDR